MYDFKGKMTNKNGNKMCNLHSAVGSLSSQSMTLLTHSISYRCQIGHVGKSQSDMKCDISSYHSGISFDCKI
jgi:hypothetical protein